MGNTRPLVVMLHGLFTPSTVMRPFARFFENQGYEVANYGYRTRTIKLDNIINDLIVLTANREMVHFIGHSLGGLLIRHYFDRTKSKTPGVVITLGTPHQGSVIAKKIKHSRLVSVLGNAGQHGLFPTPQKTWAHPQPLFCVSGVLPLGIAILFNLKQREPNDGTVLLSESRLDGCISNPHFCVSHTSMIYAKKIQKYALTQCQQYEKAHRSLLGDVALQAGDCTA